MAREREWKFDLGGDDAARRVEDGLGPPSDIRLQANRFFDTPDHALRRARWALRLRAEWLLAPEAVPPPDGAAPQRAPDRVILGFKGAREGDGAFHDRHEEQAELPAAAWIAGAPAPEQLPPAWRDLLAVAPRELVEIARFTNLRRSFPLGGTWRAEIDRTLFRDGRRAWELELEIAPGDDPAVARDMLARLFAAVGVEPQPQMRSKLQRALEPD